jgi:NSS family neurotransmitter:Na+ symporter
MDGTGMPRGRAAWLAGGAIALLGIPPALSRPVLGVMDQVAGNLFLVLGGLGIALFVGRVMAEPLEEAAAGASRLGGLFLWRFLLRWAVPALLGVVLVYAARDTWRSLVELFA